MYPTSTFWRGCRGATVVLITAAAVQTVHAQGSKALEVPEPICVVSDQHIIAATARQKVMLETAACTAGLNQMVAMTLSEIKSAYATFYRQAHLDSPAADAVSRLLVRRRLLSSSWSSDQVEHSQISKDPALPSEIQLQLQEHLTSQQMALLESYEETIPARHLLAPVVSRLERSGRPMSEVQSAAVLQATQQFLAEWFKGGPPKESTDELQRCIDSHARMNQLAERIEKILVESLEEEQLNTARAYYRDLFDRRARMFRLFEEGRSSDEAPLCAIPAN